MSPPQLPRLIAAPVWAVSAACAAVVACGSGWLLAAAQPNAVSLQEVREGSARQPAPGTAVLSGIVATDEASPRPIRHATITLEGASLDGKRLSSTDDAGRFIFSALPNGSFSLTASRLGFVPVWYGAKHPGRGPAVPIQLAEGQHTDVSMTMLHGAVITGTIEDSGGGPIPDVEVHAMAMPAPGQPERTVSSATMAAEQAASSPTPAALAASEAVTRETATTDDRGVDRIFGLPPGSYRVVALPSPVYGAARGDPHEVTPAEVQWARQELIGLTSAVSGAAAPAYGHATGYAPVYYPGTPDASAATVVALAPGGEVTASFAFRLVPRTTIAGTILGLNGPAPPASRVSLALVRMVDGRLSRDSSDSSATVGGSLKCSSVATNGAFSCSGLTAGIYTLIVRSARPFVPRGAPVPPLEVAAPTPLWGELLVTAGGEDQSGLTVTLQPGITVAGTLRFEGTALAPPTNVSAVYVTLAPPVPATVPDRLFPAAARVQADGSFAFSGVAPGPYTLQASVPEVSSSTASWTAKSAMVGGHDVLDLPLEVRPDADITGVVVTFTDQTTAISGTVFDPQGRPTSVVTIIAFPTNRTLWTDGSRRIRATQPATNGTFRINALPAGEYFVSAVPDSDPSQLADPAFLDQISAAALKVTLADGEHRTLDLKLAGG